MNTCHMIARFTIVGKPTSNQQTSKPMDTRMFDSDHQLISYYPTYTPCDRGFVVGQPAKAPLAPPLYTARYVEYGARDTYVRVIDGNCFYFRKRLQMFKAPRLDGVFVIETRVMCAADDFPYIAQYKDMGEYEVKIYKGQCAEQCAEHGAEQCAEHGAEQCAEHCAEHCAKHAHEVMVVNDKYIQISQMLADPSDTNRFVAMIGRLYGQL